MAVWKRNLSDNDYHGDKSSLSSSQLKNAYKDMNLFKATVIDGLERFDSKALSFGRMAHKFILENNEFNDCYSIFNDSMDMRTTAGKTAKKEFMANIGSKEICKASEEKILLAMRDQITNYGPAAELLGEGEPELSGYYQHEYFNTEGEAQTLDLKIRPDWINHEKRYIVDYKTTRDASMHSFTRDMKWNFNYDLSAAMYLEGAKAITGKDYKWYFIAQNKEAPYSVAVYELSEETRKLGLSKYSLALSKIKSSMESKVYQLQSEVEEI